MYSYMYGMSNDMLLLAFIGIMLLSVIAQVAVNRNFKKYARVQASAGVSAHVMATKLLRQNNSHAAIMEVGGSLTDHYNPKTNVVGLSQGVYADHSVAALAVAAHEIGHVMQYEEGYAPIRLRNAVLPVAQFGSQAAPWIILAGAFMGLFNIAMLGVVLFAAVLLFQLITLPVEFNASSRAMAMLAEGGYLSYDEERMARKVLRSAAFTYIVAALSAMLTLLRFVLMARSSRRR